MIGCSITCKCQTHPMFMRRVCRTCGFNVKINVHIKMSEWRINLIALDHHDNSVSSAVLTDLSAMEQRNKWKCLSSEAQQFLFFGFGQMTKVEFVATNDPVHGKSKKRIIQAHWQHDHINISADRSEYEIQPTGHKERDKAKQIYRSTSLQCWYQSQVNYLFIDFYQSPVKQTRYGELQTHAARICRIKWP